MARGQADSSAGKRAQLVNPGMVFPFILLVCCFRCLGDGHGLNGSPCEGLQVDLLDDQPRIVSGAIFLLRFVFLSGYSSCPHQQPNRL